MIPLASTLPSSNDGYVAAAYIVFFAIVLVYVTIMAVRLTRAERAVRKLGERSSQAPATTGGPATLADPAERDGAEARDRAGDPVERETV